MHDRIDRFARLLVTAQQRGEKLEVVPPDLRLASDAEGLQVRAIVERLLDYPVGGWKAGIPAGSAPYHGQIFAQVISNSGTTFHIPKSDNPARQVTTMAEGEIAFIIGKDLPNRDTPYTESEVVDAVQSANAAIEILQSRLPDFLGSPIPERIGDALGNGGLILGQPVLDWRRLNRKHLRATFAVNGKTIIDHVTGKDGPTDPIALLVWLANHLAGSGGLKTGQVVTTGSWTGTHVVTSGDLVVTDIEGLGSVQVSFT